LNFETISEDLIHNLNLEKGTGQSNGATPWAYAHGQTGSASDTGSRAVAQLVKWPGWPVRFARPSAA
jgi:hypothetical protein